MTTTILFDFISDPMGGLLASARQFLTKVRNFDSRSTIIVMELNRSISEHIPKNDSIIWIHFDAPNGMSALRRVITQNIEIPAIIKKYRVDTYLSLSHFLPWTIPSHVKTIIGVSNLAPFSPEAYAAEKNIKKKLRLTLLKKSILSSCHRADCVIALSEICKKTLLENGIINHKVLVIPNGVSTPTLSELALTQNPIQESDFLLSVSHFYRYKNYETLILAYSQLDSDLQQKYPLYLVGRFYDNHYVNEIRLLIAQLGLATRIHIIDGLFGVDLFSALHHCKLFIFPSLIENSPITLLEAMQCGAVVLAADVPAMREFGGSAVEYFPAQNAHILSERMISTLKNSHLTQLKMDAISQSAQFTWDSFTQKLVASYLEILQ